MKKGLILIPVMCALLLSACNSPCDIHTFGEWEITRESTCTEAGLQTRACLDCDATEEAEISAAGHSYSDWATTQEPTCTEAGLKTRTCSGCDAVEEESVPTLEHEFDEWETEKEAACLEDGSQVRHCVGCNAEEKGSIPATGHTYGEGEYLSEPDCTNDGQQRQVCTACADEVTVSVQALGHDFATMYCSRCDESKYPLSSLRTFYDTEDGLSVKVNSFTVTSREGYNQYRLDWTIKNITENSEITHGMFRLYLSDGTWIQMNGMFPYIYYKESYSFYYDFKTLKDKDVLFAEYIPFSFTYENPSDEPAEGAPRWAAP